MIRPLTIATFLMACGSGLYLYQSKHEAQVLDRTIEKTLRDTATYREQSRLLAAEWTMLNDPESLRRFSDTYLALKTITPSQFTSLADLDARLPPVPPPPTSSDSDEETGEPVAAVPEPAPVPAATEAPPAVVADHPVQAPPRPAAASPVAAIASARPPERKVAASRLPATDAASKPSATDPAPRSWRQRSRGHLGSVRPTRTRPSGAVRKPPRRARLKPRLRNPTLRCRCRRAGR